MHKIPNTDLVAMDESEYLEHFGVRGMKWGQRKAIKYAKQDAKEYQKAKFMYGDMAGTRRKLINNQVADRSKKSKVYKDTFEKLVANQDNSNALAIGEREHKKQMHKETRDRIGRRLKTAAIAGTNAAIIGGVSYAVANPKDASRKINQAMNLGSKYARASAHKVSSMATSAAKARTARKWLKENGFG
jgi:hypothetical protein